MAGYRVDMAAVWRARNLIFDHIDKMELIGLDRDFFAQFTPGRRLGVLTLLDPSTWKRPIARSIMVPQHQDSAR